MGVIVGIMDEEDFADGTEEKRKPVRYFNLANL